ncbi:conjugative transposon protein TraJ [Sinomicrobium weinanense]|uniref:Conjugative transposon protein TraJ n=1 Tax=Sinomicrobium weinanense TaxID=2842200 RepID=A0A926JQC3_9FLAO|nr:conjugative transposon protein TraJ [Sinomicrobium weinanense]MBC9795357.1 conjugative transposon protein TraJ [Sinomicrobium weinanense]MBU3122928.1 conjugative transposon protein TraJ [Sinomicrobium weinanense]
MRASLKTIKIWLFLALTPVTGLAQGSGEISSLHGVLQQLYAEMLPLCSQLIGVAQGIAGFAALWYIASRVWRHLANAESIDFYPLFRPFAIGICIAVFPSVIGLINGVMQPTVSATSAMVQNSDKAIAVLLERKEDALKKTEAWKMYVGADGMGDPDRWYRYTHDNAEPSDAGLWESLGNEFKFGMDMASYRFRHSVKEWLSEVLRVIFESATLCIDTLRTFQLIVLAILGPLVFGIAVFDGFQHTLAVWIARYLNVFLWLPIANIFGSLLGKIQQKMLELDISQVEGYGDTFFSSTDIAYMIFLIIGIVGYFTVPSMANYIIHAGGGSALTQKVTNLLKSSSRKVVSSTTTGAGMAVDAMGDVFSRMSQSMAGHGVSSDYFGSNSNTSNKYMKDKLKGNT